MAVKQTAGRDALNDFAPEFAHLNDDILFGEVWSREDKLSLRDRCIVTVTAAGLTACGNADAADTSEQSIPTLSETEETTSESAETESDETSSDASKTLVVYFSATGNTESAAEAIAKATDGDVFAIMPETTYTAADLDWTDDSSHVSVEHSDPDQRVIALETNTPESWDSYDTVFVGYPIWWGEAAYPVSTFVSENDFTDKTVIPFCTSASSDIGDSGNILAQTAGSGNWLEGRRFSASESEDVIAEWAKEFVG